jgi:hypothetical protein
MIRTLNHPVFGPLTRTSSAFTNCDWKGTILLPSLADCYGRWNEDGQEEERHSSGDDTRRGVFPLRICAGLFGRDLAEESVEPFESHIAAYRILTEQHEALANNLAEQLAVYVDNCGMGQFLMFDDEECFERLQKRDRILGTLSSIDVCLFTRSREGIAYAGFSFSTDVWDPEHGLGAVAWGTQFLGIGSADASHEELFALWQDSQG